jgi:hypothetical protein
VITGLERTGRSPKAWDNPAWRRVENRRPLGGARWTPRTTAWTRPRKYMRYRSTFPVCHPLRRVLAEASELPVRGDTVTGRFSEVLAEGLLSTLQASNLKPTHPPGKGGGKSR